MSWLNTDDRKSLIEDLEQAVVEVTFKKVNGDERIMNCTLQKKIIPETDPANKKNNDEIIPVWDIEKRAWRSFRLDSVTCVLVKEDNEYDIA